MAAWRPNLKAPRTGGDREGRPAGEAVYKRLVAAMEADVASGRLAPGARLPPQRELAHALSISVGAVTRAYDDAARRGLVAAHVGRGTFVVDQSRAEAAQQGQIDLSLNTAPIAQTHVIAETIAALRRATAWAERLDYLPPVGLDADRRAAATWLRRTGGFGELDWRSLICCSGAQNAMAIAFAALCRPGDAVLCESATFPGAKTLAALQNYRLHGVTMDAEGARPQALDRAAAATGARVFYVLPTLQNPTARTMSRERRADIVKIARARDLWIVEDDIYALYARDMGLLPVAASAPERTIYLSSLSKTLSPGVRAGFLVAAEDDLFERCVRAVRALMHSPPGIGAAVATDWIESGRADDLARDVRAETAARTAMALAALEGAADAPQAEMSLHLWLPMRGIDAERAAARALSAGVRLTAPDAFAVSDGKATGGLRLCLGAATNRATLARALQILKSALAGGADAHAQASL